MAYDKAVDSTQLDVDLTTVAAAIRAKGGTSAQLSFPSGFASAIAAISTGATVVGTASTGGSDLSTIDEVFVGDYHETTDITVTKGALDQYSRIIAA